jgi:hypothetical protein
MKLLLTLLILLASITGAYAAYVISCDNGIQALNQTGQYGNQVFDVNYYQNVLNATNCNITEIPNNQVYANAN